jgi:subtilisin family serine protease
VSPLLSKSSGRGVRIAVLDSGVHPWHPHIGGVSGGVAILPDGSLGDDFVDRIGHGTAVAAAIREKAPDADLLAVKIFDRSLTTDAGTLVRAIDWAVLAGARTINLSVGTSNPVHAHALSEAVARAGASNAIIVAAARHDGVDWLPGCLPGVVPVTLDWNCPRDGYRVASGPTGIPTFAASGYARPIPGVPVERNLKGISFAVANVTGFVALALESDPTVDLAGLLSMLIGA